MSWATRYPLHPAPLRAYHLCPHQALQPSDLSPNNLSPWSSIISHYQTQIGTDPKLFLNHQGKNQNKNLTMQKIKAIFIPIYVSMRKSMCVCIYVFVNLCVCVRVGRVWGSWPSWHYPAAFSIPSTVQLSLAKDSFFQAHPTHWMCLGMHKIENTIRKSQFVGRWE